MDGAVAVSECHLFVPCVEDSQLKRAAGGSDGVIELRRIAHLHGQRLLVHCDGRDGIVDVGVNRDGHGSGLILVLHGHNTGGGTGASHLEGTAGIVGRGQIRTADGPGDLVRVRIGRQTAHRELHGFGSDAVRGIHDGQRAGVSVTVVCDRIKVFSVGTCS